jgi:ATP-binding cassette subfamily B protein
VDTLDQPDVLVVLPLGLLFAYGALRLSSSLFNELRDAVFGHLPNGSSFYHNDLPQNPCD